MLTYRLKSALVYLGAILVAGLAWVLFYRWLLGSTTQNFVTEAGNPALALGISAITVIAPLFAIMEAMVSWLKSWRENRLKAELIRVIDSLSGSPGGMDLEALQTESGLPAVVLRERVNELVLLGRIGVKITPNHQREYSLKG